MSAPQFREVAAQPVTLDVTASVDVAPDDAAADKPALSTARPRLEAIDLVRGVVMMLMALDHTRDFFATSGMNPRDVSDPALFLTRWITHYCAPVFIFLAGMSAWLYGSRGRSTAEVSRFLLTRGLFLIVMEFTVVRLGWTFSLVPDHFVAQVIWAIGASMMVLAALVHLPRWAITAFAVALIVGHNVLDGIHASDLPAIGGLWTVLHERGLVKLGSDGGVYVLYPLVPWVGVMAAGYALGPVLRLDAALRRPFLLDLGLTVTAAFIVLRAANFYGDPVAWAPQAGWLSTALSFLNCEKYPPSLLYLMMTLGPALIGLALAERARGPVVDCIVVYGRVPFFFYVAHLFLIHALAVAFAWATTGETAWLLGLFPPQKPAGYGLSLPGIYAAWLLVLVALYPLCRWFAALKQRSDKWWLSYL
jgi:uncharacterized membrane protein